MHYYGGCSIYICNFLLFEKSNIFQYIALYLSHVTEIKPHKLQVLHPYQSTKKEQWRFLQQQLETLLKPNFPAFKKVVLKQNLHNT